LKNKYGFLLNGPPARNCGLVQNGALKIHIGLTWFNTSLSPFKCGSLAINWQIHNESIGNPAISGQRHRFPKTVWLVDNPFHLLGLLLTGAFPGPGWFMVEGRPSKTGKINAGSEAKSHFQVYFLEWII